MTNDGENSAVTTRKHFRACNLCEAICGLEVGLEMDGEISYIKGDERDPFSQGHICPKAVALKDIYQDPNRLRQPQTRGANGWETISWNAAFDIFAANIKAAQAEYGADAVAIYSGNPSVHNVGTILSRTNFLKAVKTKNNFTATSVDQLPHHFAAWKMFGHPLLLPIPDVDRTDFMLIIGANPAASNGSLMTAPGIMRRLKKIQERGGKFVVIDPRRTETAKRADRHLFIRPATDVYLLLSLVREVLAIGKPEKVRREWIDEIQISQLQELTDEFTPEITAPKTGINAANVRELARELCESKTAVVYGRMGVSVQAFGGLCQWLINVLNVLTGNCDSPGGVMFPSPAIDLLAAAKPGKNVFNRWQSVVRGLPEFDGELPVAALREEIEAGNIRALITICGNPVLSTPDGGALEKSLAKLDFYAAIDIYQNETTAHADLILPPTTGLETAHYDLVFHHLAVRNTAKFSAPLFEKSDFQKHDYEIFAELTARLNGVETENFDLEEKIALGLKYGKYAGKLSLQTLKDNPHGVDLGAHEPVFPARLLTENKKVDLVPDLIIQDLARVRQNLTVQTNDDLLLIGRRQQRSNNSWMHNSERLMRGKNRCTLMIHPQTATAQKLIEAQIVRVESSVGAIEISVEITDDIAPGVVSIPHGFGHNRRGTKLDVAEKYAGVSINDLTDSKLLDELTGNAAFSGVPVRISAIY